MTDELDEAALDLAADRVLHLLRKAQARPSIDALDVDAHHALAREAAGRSIVLLKNEGVLPLAPTARIAVIGAFAEQPRYQGAGSSLINPTRLDAALTELHAQSEGEVTYAAGFTLDGSGDAAALTAEAVAAAKQAEVAVVFLGLPADEESEGYDRDHMNLPAAQLALLDAVLTANPNVVVVLSNGGAVALPFRDRVPAIVEGWLLGQAGGGATADVLFGAVNPSGKLTETIPLRLQDNPSYGNFPGEHGHVRYGEGLFVGYRWYDERELDVAYPFGHGLSYTTFGYSDASASLDDGRRHHRHPGRDQHRSRGRPRGGAALHVAAGFVCAAPAAGVEGVRLGRPAGRRDQVGHTHRARPRPGLLGRPGRPLGGRGWRVHGRGRGVQS